ncbi:MAG TPA: 4-hydroxythreonine-4-phosphate dehydrogenase PdxA [Syntrophorhabdaceae bacterium]|jgi:4-hydroxythreonine-4-phosphate dehydrogenase
MRRIAVTMGDPAGIGAEIILKALPDLCRKNIPVVIGDSSALEAISPVLGPSHTWKFKRFGQAGAGEAEFVDMALVKKVAFGAVDKACGRASYQYILEALKYAFSGAVSAIVTAPINKVSLRLGGAPFTGHTELLAHFGGVRDYVMMMANRRMRVSLVTIHIPLRDVPDALSVEKVVRTIGITHQSLRDYFAIPAPYLKVSGLNPHAGEQGIMGTEEKVIEEAVVLARSLGIRVDGPFPGDTLFHDPSCDAFVAMYHDQGLIPVKTVDFRHTVNITLGLPFVRTSPGHGTGFDIAGQGNADPTGLIEAFRTAETMASHFE